MTNHRYLPEIKEEAVRKVVKHTIFDHRDRKYADETVEFQPSGQWCRAGEIGFGIPQRIMPL